MVLLTNQPTSGDCGFRHIFALAASSSRTGLHHSNRSSKGRKEKMGSRLLTMTTVPVDISVRSFLLANGEGEAPQWLMGRKSQASQPLPMLQGGTTKRQQRETPPETRAVRTSIFDSSPTPQFPSLTGGSGWCGDSDFLWHDFLFCLNYRLEILGDTAERISSTEIARAKSRVTQGTCIYMYSVGVTMHNCLHSSVSSIVCVVGKSTRVVLLCVGTSNLCAT